MSKHGRPAESSTFAFGYFPSSYPNVLRSCVVVEECRVGEARLVLDRREDDVGVVWDARALGRAGRNDVLQQNRAARRRRDVGRRRRRNGRRRRLRRLGLFAVARFGRTARRRGTKAGRRLVGRQDDDRVVVQEFAVHNVGRNGNHLGRWKRK